jgi:hypothetical protein
MTNPTELSDTALEAIVADCWQDLLDKDDRTSPVEYPEMALITHDELADYINSAARAAWEASPAKSLIEALEVMIEAVENGGIDSPTMDGEPEVGIPPFKWHEEWLFYARLALSSLGGSER